MTSTARLMWWLYVLAAMLTAHCGITSARNHAPWYAVGLLGVSLLLLVALAREYIAADERRAAAIKAERAARLRQTRPAIDGVVAVALAGACCETWWTSAGAAHDSTCARKDQAA